MDPVECTGHSHDHDHTDDLGLSLRPQIDLPQVFCLNEHIPNAGRSVLKIHEERFSDAPVLRSHDDDDEEDPGLLLHVPFTEGVSIQSISVRGGNTEGTSSPRTLRLYTDRNDLDFDTVRDLDPQMTLTLLPPQHLDGVGTIDYPLRPAGRFQNISSVTLYFADNYATQENPDDDDDDRMVPTEITFVGFKGRGTKMKRKAVETVYESRGMVQDHKVHGDEMGARHFV